MFGKDAFKEGLKQLGYDPEDRGDNRLAFKHPIAAGRFQGQTILVGIEVPSDFNVTCPTGPHISPRLIPINPSGVGNDRAAESPNFGADWEYLSRPFRDQREGWNRTSRDVKAYLRHVKYILETL
jgi:hypothetical protein